MQGESVQIIWMVEQPLAGNWWCSHCSSVGPQKEYRPHHSAWPSRMASWTMHLGMDCWGACSMVRQTSSRSLICAAISESLKRPFCSSIWAFTFSMSYSLCSLECSTSVMGGRTVSARWGSAGMASPW